MYMMRAFRPGSSRPGRITIKAESSEKAARRAGSRAMINMLLGTNPITASVIAKTVSNSFAFSRLTGAISTFPFTSV